VKNLSIADAVENISELNKVLDDAYWEANNCEEKDHVYNLSSILATEYIELSKRYRVYRAKQAQRARPSL